MAEEKKLNVSIDGSKAKEGADQVAESLGTMAKAAADVGAQFDRTQAILNQSWNSLGPKTASDSLKELGQSSSDASFSLNKTIAALNQSWGSQGPKQTTEALKEMGSAAISSTSSVKQLIEAKEKLLRIMKEMNNDLSVVIAGFNRFTAAAGTFKQILSVLIPVDLLADAGKKFFEVTNRLQGFLSTMNVITGATKESRDVLASLFETANKYGVNVLTLTESFAKLAAAAKGTTLEGEKIKHVFESIVVASSAMHLSSEDTRLVLYALQQMVSKGTVAFEELRRQMAERFPGAMIIAAESMGMTNQEFQKLVRTGKLFTDDFIVSFASAIKERFTPSLEISTTSMLAAVNRVQNAWEKFVMDLSNSALTQAATRGINSIAETFAKISPDVIEALGLAISQAVDYFANFMQDLDAERINAIVKAISSVIDIISTAVGLFLRLSVAMAPELDKITTKLKLFSDIVEHPDLTTFEKIIATMKLSSGDTDAYVLGFGHIKQSAVEITEQYIKQQVEADKLAKDFSGSAQEARMFASTFGVMDREAQIFFANQKNGWDSWGDQISRAMSQAKAVSPDINYYADQISRNLLQQKTVTSTPEQRLREQANLEKAITEATIFNTDAEEKYQRAVGKSDVAKRYKEISDRVTDLRGELSKGLAGQDPAFTPERHLQILQQINAAYPELTAARKAYDSMLKGQSKDEDQYTNVLGRFVSMQKSASDEYLNLAMGLGKLVPAEREWIKLQQTAQFQKYSEERKNQLRDTAEQAIAYEKAAKSLGEYYKAAETAISRIDELTQSNDKESASLSQKTANLMHGEKATEGLATAEFDRYYAMLQSTGMLERMRVLEGADIDRKIELLRVSASLKDINQDLYNSIKDYTDGVDREVRSLESETKHLNERAASLSLTKEQQDKNVLSLRELELAQVNADLAAEISSDTGSQVYIEALTKRKKALEENISALRNMANAENTRNFEQTWVRAVDTISQKFSDFVQTGINQGWRAAFKRLWDDFVSWGIAAIIKLAAQKIAISIFPELKTAFNEGNNGPFGILTTLLGLKRPTPSLTTTESVDTSALQASVENASSSVDVFANAVKSITDGTSQAAQGAQDFSGSVVDAKSQLDLITPSIAGLSGSVDSIGGSLLTFDTSMSGVSDSTSHLLESLDSSSVSIEGLSGSTTSLATNLSTTGTSVLSMGDEAGIAAKGVSELGQSAGDSAANLRQSSDNFGHLYDDLGDFSGSVGDASTGLGNLRSGTDVVVGGFGSLLHGMGGFVGGIMSLLRGLGSGGLSGVQSVISGGSNLLSSGSSLLNFFGVGGAAGGAGYGAAQTAADVSAYMGVSATAGASAGSAFVAGFASPLSTLGTAFSAGIEAAGGFAAVLGAAIPVVGTVIAGLALLGGSLFNKEPSKVRGQFRISTGTTGFEDNAYTASSVGNLGFSDENTQQFSGQAAQVFNQIVKGAIDAFSQRYSSEQRDRLTQVLQQTTFASFEGTFTTEDFIKQYGGQVLQQVITAAFDILDPALGAIAAQFKGTADEVAKFGNTLLSIYDATKTINNADFTANVYTALQGADQATADKVAAFVTIVNQFGTSIEGLSAKLEALDPQNMTKLIDSLGGAQKAVDAFTYLNTNFSTSTDRAAQAQRNLAKSWDLAGITADDLAKANLTTFPKTHEEFLQLFNSLDLNTEHGRELANTLLNNVAPAFVAVNGAADAAAQALNQQAQTGQSYYSQHFLTPSEQLLQRQTVDSTAIYAVTQQGTLLNNVLHTLGFDSVPTTVTGVRALVNATLAKYGADSLEYKTLMAIIPTIGDLIDSVNGFGAAATSVAKQLTTSVGGLIKAGTDLAATFLSNVSSLAGQSTGDFGTKLGLQISLINDAIASANRADFSSSTAYDAYINKLKSSASTFTDQLSRFTVLSAQYDASRAEQLVNLQDWYDAQRKIFGANSLNPNVDALTALQTIFQQKWDAIVNGAAAAATSLDDFIKSIQDLAKNTGGDAGQMARLQLAMTAPKLADLEAQYAQLAPTDATAQSILSQINKLKSYNDQLNVQIAHFAQYSAQYGVDTANKLIELEGQYEQWKSTVGDNADALAVLAEIFQDQWQKIVDGVNGTGNALDDLKKKIRDFLDSLKTSDLSPLTPMQKLQSAQDLYLQTLSKAQAGDQTALGEITQQAQDYLKLAREAYASSQAYTDIFNAVTSALAILSDYQTAPATSPVSPVTANLTSTTDLSSPASLTVQGVLAQMQDSVTSAADAMAAMPDYTAQFVAIEDRLDALIGIEQALPDYTELLMRIAGGFSPSTEPFGTTTDTGGTVETLLPAITSNQTTQTSAAAATTTSEKLATSEDVANIGRKLDSILQAFVLLAQSETADSESIVEATREVKQAILDLAVSGK